MSPEELERHAKQAEQAEWLRVEEKRQSDEAFTWKATLAANGFTFIALIALWIWKRKEKIGLICSICRLANWGEAKVCRRCGEPLQYDLPKR